MGWIIPAISIDCGFKFAVMLILFIRYMETKERVIFWWAIGWLFFGLHATIELILIGTGYEFLWFIRHIAYAFTAVAFLQSVGYMSSHNKKTWHIVSAAVGISAVISSYLGVFIVKNWYAATIPTSFLNGLGFIACAFYFLKLKKENKGIIKLLVFLGFLLSGLHNLDYPFLRPVAWFAPIGFSLGVVFSLIVAIGLIMISTEELSKQREESRRIAQNLFILNTIAETVSKTLNLEEILNAVLDKILETVKIEAGCIFLLDEPNRKLVVNASRGISQECMQEFAKLKLDKKTHCSKAVFTGKPVISSDISEYEDIKSTVISKEKLISSVSIPLKSKENVRGVLAIFSHKHRHFPTQEIQLLTSIGNSVGVAIDNAQLYNAIEKWGRRLESEVEKRTKELRETQNRLIRSEKLAAIGQLAKGVGHELRNSLGVLKNCAYYLKNIIKTENGEVIKYLNIIEKEVTISDKIINNLLEFTQLNKVIYKPLNCAILIDAVLLATEVPEDIEVKKDLAQNLPKVMANSEQLYQVFINIILNAYQSMPNGGKLLISTRKEEEFIEIVFKDKGCGISKKNLDKIFEPLFTTKTKGVGLGLTICKSIIEAHGGKLDVQSEVNKGTTFTLKLTTASEIEGAII